MSDTDAINVIWESVEAIYTTVQRLVTAHGQMTQYVTTLEKRVKFLEDMLWGLNPNPADILDPNPQPKMPAGSSV